MSAPSKSSSDPTRNPRGTPLPADVVFEARRAGLSSFLFAILRPGDARSAAVHVNAVRLTFALRTAEVALGELEVVEVKAGWRWSGLRLRHARGETAVSGLSHADAKAFAEALEKARVGWWRRTLAEKIGDLRSVHDRLAQLADPSRYVSIDFTRGLVRDAERAAGGLAARWPNALSQTPEIRVLKPVLEFLEAPDQVRTKTNETFVANELVRSRSFFDRIEARPLTEEQRRIVVADEQRNLVVAAAGSGKTSLIVAKVGWLLRKGYRLPAELLLLAFAKDARNKMEERICQRLGTAAAPDVAVRTFHSLGMAIIGEAEGKRPTLAKTAETDRALFDLLKGIIVDLLADGEGPGALRKWFQAEFAPYKSKHECKSWGEYWDYIRKYDIRSLKGETVKSYEECEIANFLYLNGVAYEYEASYEHDTATADKRQYKPDFFLPEAGIYIEHFGLDANGKTAPFIDAKQYRRGMEWKRQVHAEHGTVLIETFSRERAEGTLIRNLMEKLAAHGVSLSPIPREKVFAALNEQGRIDPFTRLLATFLQHFKGANLSIAELAGRAATLRGPRRAESFLTVFEPVFKRYQETLVRSGEIDFHDMINRATDLVEAGRYRNPFSYILVDEFQDISPARARLLKALLNSSPDAQLFAVGDDWQAIYRFSGSDIVVMREFRERFGECKRMELGTTFRCAGRITDVATEFVLRNPAQIRRSVRSIRNVDGPGVHVGFPSEEGLSLLKAALDRIAEDAAGHDGESSVLLLGRYRHLCPRNMTGLAKQFPGLRLSYMTVHSSKGLEADYVVVLGLCSGKYGFPVEIADDPLLDLVLAVPERHPNAEERRVLYVAMTRARRRVFLLADGGPPSAFAKELIDEGYDVDAFGRPPEDDVSCPKCKEGRLVRRESTRNKGAFYGCSNWPYCHYTSRPCPGCGTGLPVRSVDAVRCRDCGVLIENCPVCSGWLETRMGRNGRFLGCSNWPDCDYTRNMRQPSRRQGTSSDNAGFRKRR